MNARDNATPAPRGHAAYVLRAPDRRPVGRLRGHQLTITDQHTSRMLRTVRRLHGGVLAGPEGPRLWTPDAVVNYLLDADYELEPAQTAPDEEQRRIDRATDLLHAALAKAQDPEFSALLRRIQRADDDPDDETNDDTSATRDGPSIVMYPDEGATGNWLREIGAPDGMADLTPAPPPLKYGLKGPPPPPGKQVIAVRLGSQGEVVRQILVDADADLSDPQTIGYIHDVNEDTNSHELPYLGFIQFGYWEPPPSPDEPASIAGDADEDRPGGDRDRE